MNRVSFRVHLFLPFQTSNAHSFFFHPTLSEVLADETPSVQVVINSDVKRLELIKEEKELKDKLETSNDPGILDRYNEVSGNLFYISICGGPEASYMWFKMQGGTPCSLL